MSGFENVTEVVVGDDKSYAVARRANGGVWTIRVQDWRGRHQNFGTTDADTMKDLDAALTAALAAFLEIMGRLDAVAAEAHEAGITGTVEL